MNKQSVLPQVIFIICLSVSLFSLAGSYLATQGVLPEVFQQVPYGGSVSGGSVGGPSTVPGASVVQSEECWWVLHHCNVQGCEAGCDGQKQQNCLSTGHTYERLSPLLIGQKKPKEELQILGVALAQDVPAPSTFEQDNWCCGGGGGGGSDSSPQPVPSPGTFRCEDLGPIPTSPQPGQTLVFTCTSGANNVTIDHYNFRVNEGTVTKVTTGAVQAQFNYVVPAGGGTYTVQCQVCSATKCTAWGQMN